MSDATENTTTSSANAADASVEQIAAEFLSELRQRLGDDAAEPVAELLAPAVARLTDRLTVLACDRLARGDVTSFFETVLEAMTPEERSVWRREVTEGWFQAALIRWQDAETLRTQVLETILAVKALVL
ncbi:MAG: hypothetical protein JXL80_10010 [Planctomycetes bacterium]|nr:hypothetical protein [Planctomycetota bacterium]